MKVHSRAQSHYCLPRGLLTAGFHPWPGSPFLSQPEHFGLLQSTHIDDKLSADALSTCLVHTQNSSPSNQSTTRLLSSQITGDAKHPVEGQILKFIQKSFYYSIVVNEHQMMTLVILLTCFNEILAQLINQRGTRKKNPIRINYLFY